jgi:hypothetical protein
MSKNNGEKQRIELRAQALHEKAGLNIADARGIACSEFDAQVAFETGGSSYTQYRYWCSKCRTWQTSPILLGLTERLYCAGCAAWIPTNWERRLELHKKIRELKLNMVQDGLIIIALISLAILIIREMLQ